LPTGRRLGTSGPSVAVATTSGVGVGVTMGVGSTVGVGRGVTTTAVGVGLGDTPFEAVVRDGVALVGVGAVPWVAVATSVGGRTGSALGVGFTVATSGVEEFPK
jgi:hypothetical protein